MVTLWERRHERFARPDARAAFVDVGSEQMHVSVAGGPPRVFGTVTTQLHACSGPSGPPPTSRRRPPQGGERPLIPLLRSPAVLVYVPQLVAFLRFDTSLPPRVLGIRHASVRVSALPWPPWAQSFQKAWLSCRVTDDLLRLNGTVSSADGCSDGQWRDPSSVRPRRGRPRDPAVEQRVVAAARRQFHAHGYEKTSMDAVAAESVSPR